MEILSLIVISMIGEAVWETLKMIWERQKINFDRIGALVISLILSFGTGLDVLSLIGIPTKIPFVGIILTGILISRGTNFMHDLVCSISNIYQNTKCVPQGNEQNKMSDKK